MLRTVGLLALPRRTWSAGFDGGISPSWRFVSAQLLGGWDLTETGLSPASHSRLLWTHNSSALRHAPRAVVRSAARIMDRTRTPSRRRFPPCRGRTMPQGRADSTLRG